MNLMSSTLLTEDTGVPFDELQAEQIALFRAAWAEAGWEREPRVSVSRSVMPIVSDLDRAYFGSGAGRRRATRSATSTAAIARFGRSYIGEPDVIAEELAARRRRARGRHAPAHRAQPARRRRTTRTCSQTIAEHVAPAIGWQPAPPG